MADYSPIRNYRRKEDDEHECDTSEADALREALAKYGEHLPDCEALTVYKDRVDGTGSFTPDCTCGLAELLRGASPHQAKGE